MAYTAKYASAFYGPFREALASAPKPGALMSSAATVMTHDCILYGVESLLYF